MAAHSIFSIMRSAPMRNIVAGIPSLAGEAAPLFILGSVGMEGISLAHLIHLHSDRFREGIEHVSVRGPDWAMLGEQLFGTMRTGFFRGRDVVPGLLARPDLGTVVIDSVDLLSHADQERLLDCAIQRRLPFPGSDVPVELRSRLIFVSEAAERKWAVSPRLITQTRRVQIAPLAKRREDILPLAEFFLRHFAVEFGDTAPTLTREARLQLRHYPWPGNVRELQRVIAVAVLQAERGKVDSRHLEFRHNAAYADGLIDHVALETIVEDKIRSFFQRLKDVEIDHLYQTIISRVEKPLLKLTMEKADGNQLRAARMLGMNRNTLRSKLVKLGMGK